MTNNSNYSFEESYDPKNELKKAETMILSFNRQQKEIFDLLMPIIYSEENDKRKKK